MALRRQVDNGEPAVAERHAGGIVAPGAGAVRPPMRQASGHAGRQLARALGQPHTSAAEKAR